MSMRPSNCPNHVQLDLYLLGADKGALDWIGEHLQSCPTCRFQAERRKADFASYAESPGFRGQADMPSVLTFVPWHQGHEQDLIRARLAAKGREDQPANTSLTMISSDQRVMMKVVQDSKTNDAWLYLLSDYPEVCRRALIFPFKLEQGYITDDTGRVNLGKIEWPSDDRLTAELRLPTATFHLVPLVRYEQGSSQIIESESGDVLKITYYAEGTNRRLEIQIVELRGMTEDSPVRLAVCGRDSTQLQILPASKTRSASFGDLQDTGDVDLYLYQ